MAEYIEKESTINKICNEKCRSEYGKCQKGKHDNKFIFCVCDFIRWQKPADVAPVVHGRWEHTRQTIDTLGQTQCTNCGWWALDPSVDGVYHYCPNCGAKMDLTED